MRQFLVVPPDVFTTDGVEIIHGGVEADGAGDVRSAGLEPMRRVLVLGLVVADAQDHFTAALIGRHGVEHFRASPQHADAGGPANFMAGEGEEITAEGLNIHRQMPGALRAIHEGGDAEFARAGAEVGNGSNRAHGI